MKFSTCVILSSVTGGATGFAPVHHPAGPGPTAFASSSCAGGAAGRPSRSSHGGPSTASCASSTTSLLYASTPTTPPPETREFTKELKSILSPAAKGGSQTNRNNNKRGGSNRRHNQQGQGQGQGQAERAEEYLLSNLARADVVSVTKVVAAWGRSRHPTAPDRAAALVSRIDALATQLERPDLRPNEYTYNALINCYARRGMASEAEEYLQVVKDKPGLRADVVTYNSVINAHAAAGHRRKSGGQSQGKVEGGAAARALELLEEMKSLSSGDHTDKDAKDAQAVRPDAITYGSVIKCLARAGGRSNAERAEQLLTELEARYDESGGTGTGTADDRLATNTIIYNSVLDAYASLRGGEGIDRAEALLDRMEERRAEGYAGGTVSPDAFTFSSLIKAWTSASAPSGKKNKGKKKYDDDEKEESSSDDQRRRGHPSAAERAQQLLERMEELHRGGDDNVRPNAVVYNSVIAAWAKSGEAGAAERAQELLARMQRLAQTSGGGGGDDGENSVRADTISFNSAIDAWARSEEYGSAERAEALLDSMERQHAAGDGGVRPDVRSFNACINAWAHTGGPGAALRAEQLLDRLEALHAEDSPGSDDEEALRPTRITYATVIHAHARSFKKGCGEAAEAILDHMEELYEEDEEDEARPNPVAFNAVLKAWQNSEAGLSPPRAEGLLMRMMEYVDKNNGREIRDANDTFELVVRILDASYDKDAIDRIDALRSGLNE